MERLDTDRSGMVMLARVAVVRRITTPNVLLTASIPSADTAGLASSMSTATAQLADTVAGLLAARQSGRNAQSVELAAE